MRTLAIIVAALALIGCVPLAAGVVGYEVAKNQQCWRQPVPIVYPNGQVYVPPPVNVC